jgi:hypothetical protein
LLLVAAPNPNPNPNQEELALREEVRAAGARLQLLVQSAEIAGAPTARLRDNGTRDPRLSLSLTLSFNLSLSLAYVPP